jgi:hypothetical protein
VCDTGEEKLLALEASGIATKNMQSRSRRYDTGKLEALSFMPAEAGRTNY